MTSPNYTADLFSQLIDRLPHSLREELISDAVFQAEFGFAPLKIADFAGHQVRQDDLFAFIRKLSSNEQECGLPALDGSNIEVKARINEKGAAELYVKGAIFHISAAGLLALPVEDRLRILETEFQGRSIPKVDRELWIRKVKESTLSDDDFGRLQEMLEKSIEGQCWRINQSIQNGLEGGVTELLPDFRVIFDVVLPRWDGGSDIWTFLEGSLRQLRQILTEDEPSKIFSILGPSWVLPDTEVLGRLNGIEPTLIERAVSTAIVDCNDPYSLLFAFEVCIDHLGGIEHSDAAAQEILEKLFAKESEALFQDYFAAIQIAHLAALEARQDELAELWFRRLAVWTYAGFISREFRKFEFERKRFLSHVQAEVGNQLIFSGLVERWTDPYFRTTSLSPASIRGDILRRVEDLISRIPEGRVPQSWVEILQACREDVALVEKSYRFSSGPFSSFTSKESPLHPCDPKVEDYLRENGSGLSDAKYLARLQPIATLMNFSEEFFNEIVRRGIQASGTVSANEDSNDVFLTADLLAYLSGIRRREDLAGTAVLVAFTYNDKSNCKYSLLVLYNILAGSVAFSNFEDRAKFIEKHVLNLAYRRMNKDSASTCRRFIERLLLVNPSMQQYLSSAIACLRIAERSSH